MRREDAHLPVEAQDAAIHVRLLQPHSHVIAQVTRREIVRAVDDHVVIGGDAHGVRGRKQLRVNLHIEMRIDVQQSLAGRLQLLPAEILLPEENLPL